MPADDQLTVEVPPEPRLCPNAERGVSAMPHDPHLFTGPARRPLSDRNAEPATVRCWCVGSPN
jgi:hypothetical protein